MSEIDGIPILSLIERFGSPLFVVSAKKLRDSFITFRKEFSSKYPRVEVAYSYKANPLSGLLRIIHDEGAWAEVASGFEYEIARGIGVSGNSIVFNGPYKRKDELIRALEDRALINVDNVSELKLIDDIASELGKIVEIGIRFNTNVGIEQFTDRFGFNLESGEALEVVRTLMDSHHVRIVGLHLHLTSYIIEPEFKGETEPAKLIKLIWPKASDYYRNGAEKVTRFAEEVQRTFGIKIKYLDLGGGFPTVESLSPYVDAIVEPIIFNFKHDLPLLILEPGRAIVKDAMNLISTVVSIKTIADRKRGIVVDAGINLLPTSLWRYQQIESVEKFDTELAETIVYGPLCLQTDIIGKCDLPELEVGDHLIIKNVGAYNIAQSSSFIFPRPNIVLIDKGEINLLRRSETIEEKMLFEN